MIFIPQFRSTMGYGKVARKRAAHAHIIMRIHAGVRVVWLGGPAPSSRSLELLTRVLITVKSKLMYS